MEKRREERLQQQLVFCREIDKEKQIKRQTYQSDGKTRENDAEHAWHMAIMAIMLSEYSNEKIDVLKTVSMLQVHDLVEIYAGDTYAYAEEGKKTQHAREVAAAERIFGLLPEDQGKNFRALWDEFESGDTPESRFARTMDRVQPLMLNAASEGKSWKEHGIHLSQILGRNGSTKDGSTALWEHVLHNFIEPYVDKGCIKND